MDRIREQVTTPVLIGAGVGLVLGLVLGLIIGWGIWPVQWVDAGVQHLRDDLQRDYMVMAIQSFAQTNNAQQAQTRWAEMEAMGAKRAEMLAEIQQQPPAGLSPDAVNSFATVVQAGPLPAANATLGAGGAAGGQQDGGAAGGVPGGLSWALGLMCLLTLIIGAIFLYMFVFKNRRPALASSRSGGGAAVAAPGRAAPEPTPYAEGQEPPIVQFLTTYNLGNDLYDESNSIDSPNGDFLGECGVSISETIGVGDPKKVTAFEVWLFDKNDIQTVTKVVMSQHAFNDAMISQRLSSRGDPVLAEPGKSIYLETATLVLEARVVNMNYGQGALPANSYFEQMTFELQAWSKPRKAE